ncbi:MAG: FecR family protein [Gemmatimonadota bacterium]
MTDNDILTDADYELIGRYLANELSDVDRADFESWASSSVERRAAVVRAREVWLMVATSSSHPDVDVGWSKLTSDIELRRGLGVSTGGQNGRAPARSLSHYWRNTGAILRAAAVLALVAGTAVVWNRLTQDETSVSESSAALFETAPGVRRSLDLADGSRVELGVASRLEVIAGYGGRHREVTLSGEAFFTVTHDDARPFVVRVGESRIEDRGTEFSVRRYPEDSATVVAVSSGVVAVSGPRTQAVVLEARDIARLVGDAVAVERGVDIGRQLAFRSGELAFDNTPMSLVIPEIERWFDVEFRLSGELLTRTLNVTFAPGTALETVLDVVGATLEVRFERRGRVVEVVGPERTGLSSASGRGGLVGGGM